MRFDRKQIFEHADVDIAAQHKQVLTSIGIMAVCRHYCSRLPSHSLLLAPTRAPISLAPARILLHTWPTVSAYCILGLLSQPSRSSMSMMYEQQFNMKGKVDPTWGTAKVVVDIENQKLKLVWKKEAPKKRQRGSKAMKAAKNKGKAKKAMKAMKVMKAKGKAMKTTKTMKKSTAMKAMKTMTTMKKGTAMKVMGVSP